MNKCIAFLISVLSVILTSCRNSESQRAVDFTLNDFKFVQLSAPDTIECEGLFLAKPATIQFHPDGFLFVADRKNVKMLHIIDLENRSSTMGLPSGRAENELLTIWDITVHDRDVYLSSIYESKLLKLHYIPDNRVFLIDSCLQFPNQFMRCIPYKNGYLTFASASSKDRFYLWEGSTSVTDTVGSFPTDGIIGNAPLHNGVLQSDISVHGNKIVSSYKGIDYIDIYKDNILDKRIHGPVHKDVEVKERVFGNGAVSTSLSPDMSVFNKVIASENGFWVGYVGFVSNGKDIPTPEEMRIKKILHFSWDGEPDMAYLLDKSIEDFAIDANSNVLYCLIVNPEPAIISYSLM